MQPPHRASNRHPISIQELRFKDGYTTTVETVAKLNSKQYKEFQSADRRAKGVLKLKNRLGKKVYQQKIDVDELREKEAEAEAKVSEMRAEPTSRKFETTTSNGTATSIGQDWSTDDATDGNVDVNWTLPILNSTGGNYKVSDNRCGVAQRSAYISYNTQGIAEVFTETSSAGDINDATVTFAGDIKGTVTNIAMGGDIQVEGFIRSGYSGAEDSVLIGDYSLNSIADGKFLNNVQFGPYSGTLTDQSYTDYEFDTDINEGPVEVGLRMYVGVSGFRGGVTQVEFMPRKRVYQPPDLGIEYAYIDIEY